MIVVGIVSTPEFKEQILMIAKIYIIGQRAQFLSREAKNKQRDKKQQSDFLTHQATKELKS